MRNICAIAIDTPEQRQLDRIRANAMRKRVGEITISSIPYHPSRIEYENKSCLPLRCSLAKQFGLLDRRVACVCISPKLKLAKSVRIAPSTFSTSSLSSGSPYRYSPSTDLRGPAGPVHFSYDISQSPTPGLTSNLLTYHLSLSLGPSHDESADSVHGCSFLGIVVG